MAKMKSVEVLTVLFKGKVTAWFGGDGNRVPVWEDNKQGRKEAQWFLNHNRYHKPVIVKALIVYQK